jgi:hypothetical protein
MLLKPMQNQAFGLSPDGLALITAAPLFLFFDTQKGPRQGSLF